MIELTTMRTCTKCGVSRNETEFNKATRGPGGLHWWCRPCSIEQVRRSRAKHPDKAREWARNAYWRNVEKRRAQSLARRNADPIAANAAAKEWRHRNPEKVKANLKRWRSENKDKVATNYRRKHLKKKFGLSESEYLQMVTEQQGKCLICRQVPTKRLFVDHCHETTTVRGLLCGPCNSLLGMAQDSVEILTAAIEYLRKFAAQRVA